LNLKKNIIDINCFIGIDSIIHLSGEKVSRRWTKKYRKKIYESKISSTMFMYNSIRDLKFSHKIKSFICASAIGIYKSDDKTIYDEKKFSFKLFRKFSL